jgi:TetR/AcrR family transcriptional regulator, mexJK operon transcriptional repressor
MLPMTDHSDPQPTGAADRQPPTLVEDRSTRKRRTVMDAATTLFLERGYLGTSVDQIAALAEVSKPTIYRFFADKEQLLTELVLDTLDRRGNPFRAELAALAQTNDLSRDLRNLSHDYIKTVTQPNGLALRRLVIGASHQLPDLAQTYYERAQDQTLAALATVFAQLAARGLLTIDEPMTAAAHFAFLVLGRALDKSLFSPAPPFADTQLKEQADAGVTAFLGAYGTSTQR